MSEGVRPSSRRGALLMVGLAAVGLAIALYLAWVKLSGGTPVCGVLAGCETVNSSEYALLFGIPVALFGAAGAALILAAAFAWWRWRDRRGLVAAYVLGLFSLPVLAYLTYLELFVIHAVCIWCVAFAAATIGGWLAATYELTRKAS